MAIGACDRSCELKSIIPPGCANPLEYGRFQVGLEVPGTGVRTSRAPTWCQ